MNRFFSIIVAMLITASAVCGAAEAIPRIVLLHTAKRTPSVDEVKTTLVEQFKELDIAVEVSTKTLDKMPRTSREWYRTADEASKVSGTLAVFGYLCEKRGCRLYVIMSHNRTLVELPLRPRHKDEQTLGVASTIRETLLGPLLPEINRLVAQGRKPKHPISPGKAWARPPYEKERKTPSVRRRPWLWLEGGYHGDHPYPNGHPIHGPWFGVEMEPTPLAGVSVNLGWLGIRRAEADGGSVRIHRLTPSIAVRLIIPVGPAHLALAPVARFDAAFVQYDHVGRDDSKETNFELQVGGLATWYLPLMPRLDVVVGAGVLVSVVGEGTEVMGTAGQWETAVPASVIRLIWTAGIAWSPIR